MSKDSISKNDYLDFVENQWENYFLDKGYIKEEPAKITSKIDSSVVLIGSTTNTLKKYIVNETIGKEGRFIIQNCMRTQGLKNLKNSEYQMFGSYFKCLGIITEYSSENLDKVVFETFDYFVNKLNISTNDIKIRINSQDKDLLNSIESIDNTIKREIDTLDEVYYTHKYGDNVGGITGRHFNISIRIKGTNTFLDIGNVVVMENSEKKHAIEMGFGNLVLSMAYFGLDSVIAASRMADIYDINSPEKVKFMDAVISSAVLQNEGISKDADCSKYFKRLLKQHYGGVINYWKDKLQVNDDQILEYMQKFITMEYKTTQFKPINSWS